MSKKSNSHYIIIPLTQGKFALVDIDDADLGTYQWCMTSRYAARRENQKTLFMHRIILERILHRSIRDSMLADHINGDPLDNRKSNLREVTRTQNAWNSGTQKNNLSQYTGVSYRGGNMLGSLLWTIVVVLVVLWLLGLIFHVAGGLVWILLVVALIVLIYNLVAGSRTRRI